MFLAIGILCMAATLTCFAAPQIHADYLASFQRMQSQFGNGVTGGINTYDPTTLQLKTYEFGAGLGAGEKLYPYLAQLCMPDGL